jgi:ankyrin repeat protein
MKINMIVLLSLFIFTIPLLAQDIHEAANSGSMQKVKMLLEKDPELVNAIGETGRMPLHWACKGVHFEIVEYLVANGADVNALDQNRIAPLHSIAARGHVQAAKLLIQNGAKIDIRGRRNNTPLLYAAMNGEKDIAVLLLEHGADIEAKDDYKRTPLLLVARESGNVALARYLITKGADINAIDKYDDTPLILSAWRGFRDLVQLLLEAGATLPASQSGRQSLLEMAVNKKLEKLFNVLVDTGVDLNIKNDKGGTMLHAAANGGSVQIIQTFLDKRFQINQQDNHGWTPLHYATEKGRSKAIQLLIDEGADINARTSIGQTPYNITEEYKYTSGNPVDVLINNDADTGPVEFPLLQGDYFGYENPGIIPKIFTPGIVSGHYRLHSTVVFSPDGQEAYWTISYPPRDSGYGKGMIMFSKIENGHWTKPEVAPFNIKHRGDVPFFHPDGTKLYYISREPLKEGDQGGKENIWYVVRKNGKWINPMPLGPAVNSLQLHWQFSVDKHGNLCFSGHYAKFTDGEYEKAVPISEAFKNTTISGGSPFISPNSDYLLFAKDAQGRSDDDLFVSFRKGDGSWTDLVTFGPEINTSAHEMCPIVSVDQKYLFFLRNGVVYWVDTKIIEDLKSKVLNL